MSQNPSQSNTENIPEDTTNSHTTSDPGEALFMMVLQHQRRLAELVESSHGSGQRRRSINRERVAGHTQLVNDYFSAEPVYTDDMFRRRFRMRKKLFLRIVTDLKNHPNGYFTWRQDAARRKCLSPLQKCTAAIRQLAYGGPADQLDEYLRMGETTALECLSNFCQCVMQIYGGVYLIKPNATDIARLLEMHEQSHGFPGMLGSLDCMHWAWKNCLVAWRAQYTRDDHGYPTIVLEAVASADLWICHAFFGVAGSRNDINVLNESPLFNDVLQENTPQISFIVNGTQYTKGYYLTDGIYPEWSTFVKSFSCPQDPKRMKFKERQEAARKDVERAFGVLQSRWTIIRGPARHWFMDKCKEIMYTCIILHNMIVEDEGHAISIWDRDEQDTFVTNQGSTPEFGECLRRNSELRDSQVHHQLRHDLVEHIWETCRRDQ